MNILSLNIQGLGHKMKKDEAVGNLGGILCVWEATVFKKDYATILDNFVAIYGTWLPSNSKVLFVAIYAPQQISRKRLLWDYVSTLIDRWNGEVVVLRDFNEVWNIDERHGSCFNPTSARVFDQFILALGLVDVKMEGYTFTWSHPSGSKMSKLDRFLVSEGRFCSDPISVLSLLISLEGFDAMVEQTWRSFSHNDANMMIHFKEKIQDLKKVIRSNFSGNIGTLLALIYVTLLSIFFETGSFPNGCNSSFVALILKITDAKFVNDFRPISLIRSVHKVVTKADFRWPFILNELLHWCTRKKKQVIFLKLISPRHMIRFVMIICLMFWRLSSSVTFGASGFGELSAPLRPRFW
nr:RNA-directed DNA polymerase, eukaryota [Tanacetum cinerariifolium]